MSIAVIEKQGTTLNVRPEGQLNTGRTPLLDKELRPHLEGIQQIVMDFSNVEYISSTGLRLLMWLEQKMEENGGEVQVINANQEVLKIFDLVGFMEVIHVVTE